MGAGLLDRAAASAALGRVGILSLLHGAPDGGAEVILGRFAVSNEPVSVRIASGRAAARRGGSSSDGGRIGGGQAADGEERRKKA